MVPVANVNHWEVMHVAQSQEYATMPKEQLAQEFYESWKQNVVPTLQQHGKGDIVQELDGQIVALLNRAGIQNFGGDAT